MRSPSRFLSCFAAAAAAGALLACSEIAGSERPIHLVWVVMDSSSARQFHLWGASEASSPNLDAIAHDAVLFEAALAQWPSTLTSTSSFLTGLYPNPLLPPQRLSEPGIATTLRAVGWRTAALSENPFVAAEHGFAREFGVFEAIEPLRVESGIHDRARRDTARTIARGLDWIDQDRARPFFLYLHLLPPHAPYDPPEPFSGLFRNPDYTGRFDGSLQPVLDVMLGRAGATREDLRNLRLAYLENIAYVDYQLGRLYQGLRERRLLDDTLLIVTSDHGEAFGEHGKVFHGSDLHHEQIHVPLVIRFPKRFGVQTQRVAASVELRDLVPTVLDVTAQPPLAQGGQSLLRVVRGEEPARDSARSWLTQRSELSASLTQGRYKLILPPTDGAPELYDLQADPGERRNLIEQHPVVARLYETMLAEPVRMLRSEQVEVDDGLRARLKAIGYLEWGEAKP